MLASPAPQPPLPPGWAQCSVSSRNSCLLCEQPTPGTHWGPGLVEGAHGDLEASALRDQHVLLGDAHVLKDDPARVGAALAHVQLLEERGATESDCSQVQPIPSFSSLKE